MKRRIVAVGRGRCTPEAALFDRYAARLRPPLLLDEVDLKSAPPPDRRPAAEYDLLAPKLKTAERVVALDERGKALDSPALAKRLSDWRDAGVRETAFLVGGAYGLDPRLRDGADLALALGALTWPHLLVRAMLAEQLYRAEQIRLGAPYHHG